MTLMVSHNGNIESHGVTHIASLYNVGFADIIRRKFSPLDLQAYTPDNYCQHPAFATGH